MTQLDHHTRPELNAAIRAALLARCTNANDRVRIESDATGCVVVEGEVEDWNERQLVEEVVSGVPGVTRVDCRLIVDD